MSNAEEEKIKIISNISINYNENKLNIKRIILKTDIKIIIINTISFILIYFSFKPLSSYFFPISYFLYPIDLISFLFLFISSIISSYIIFSLITKKIKNIHILYNIFYYIILFFIHHSKPIGNSSYDQGFVIFYIYIFLNIQNVLIVFTYLKIKVIYNLGKGYKELNSEVTNINTITKRNNLKNILYLVIVLICLILMHILLGIKKKELLKCDNWDIGLNGTRIINDNLKYSCQIQKPEGYCYMDYFKGYFDISDANTRDCSIRDAEKEKKALEEIRKASDYKIDTLIKKLNLTLEHDEALPF
jgi:hypothetical protein